MLANLKLGKKKTEPTTEIQETPTETITEEAVSSVDYSAADETPDHFDDLIGDAPETETTTAIKSSDMIDHAAFHALFCVSFNTASAVTKLKSLSVDKDDDACQNCTRALYETIYDIPMLHFMLKPSGKWMERAVAIGMFTVPMAMGVSAELAARRVPVGGDNEQPSSPAPMAAMNLKEMAEAQGA